MQIEILSPVTIFRGLNELTEDTFLKDKEFIGKTFDSEDELQMFVTSFENKHNCEIESLTFTEHHTDEEEEEEWSDTLTSAMRESEETGVPLDHIMGEILGGIRMYDC